MESFPRIPIYPDSTSGYLCERMNKTLQCRCVKPVKATPGRPEAVITAKGVSKINLLRTKLIFFERLMEK